VNSNQLRSLNGVLYALSSYHSSSENTLSSNILNAAHARDMVHLRDALTSQQYDTIFPNLVTYESDLIQPSVSIPQHDREDWKHQRRMTTLETDSPNETALSTKNPPALNLQSRKPTTANAFFTSNQSRPKTISTTSSLSSQSKASKSKISLPEKENSDQLNTTTSNTATPLPLNKVPCRMGNVDDFVGDTEEDDEFLQQEALRQERRSKAEEQQTKRPSNKRQSAPQRSPFPASLDSPKHQQYKKYSSTNTYSIDQLSQSSGGTDTESHPKVAVVVAPGIKRRKKLVDKTTMDEHGYLHTETVVVWEELPEDNDSPLESSQNQHSSSSTTTMPKPSASRPVKSTVNFKQGTLRGFFTPK
jgi:hypothetical protein